MNARTLASQPMVCEAENVSVEPTAIITIHSTGAIHAVSGNGACGGRVVSATLESLNDSPVVVAVIFKLQISDCRLRNQLQFSIGNLQCLSPRRRSWALRA